MQTIPGSPGWAFKVPDGASVPALFRRVKDPNAGPDDPEYTWQPHLPWCPQVDAVYVLSDSDGSTLDVQLELSVADQVEMVRLDDVRDGLVWTRYHAATGASSRHVKDVLSNVVLWHVSQRERIPIVPMWQNGRLILPPPRVLPAGYLDANTIPERVQRGAWRQIAAHARRNPKLALACGAALGGVYIESIPELDSFWIHMTGASSQGKTSTIRAAAAIFGAPRSVVTLWAGSALGVGAQLGELGCLTAFKEELGSCALQPAALEKLILKTTEGNQQTVSTRQGNARRSRPWRGVLVSTGNETITGRLTNEALAARVVEISTPLLADADTADDVKRLASVGAGWPIAQSLSTDADMPGLIETAKRDLSQAHGGVARRLDVHLAVTIAGAALLDQMCGTDAFRPAALAAAHDIRRQLAAELAERGLSPMDRLAAAVMEEMAADPALFPTISQYRTRMVETKIAGINMRGDDSTPATVAVLPNALKMLAARHGIIDVTPAVRDGAKDGRVLAQGDRYQRVFRLDSDRTTRAYFLRIDDLHEPTGNTGNTGNIPAQRPPSDGPVPVTAPVTTPVTGPPQLTLAPDPAPAPAATWTRAEECAPCVDCGQPTPMRDASGRPQHAYALCTAPGPRVAPAASSTPPRDYDAEVSAFAATVRRRFPDASDADVEAAYTLWQLGTRGVRFTGSPASTGLSWFLKVNAQHGAIPELDPRKHGKPDGVEHVVSLMDGLAPEYAPTTGAHVTGLDVNAQYLAAAGSVECGVGAPRTLGGTQLDHLDILGLPGYVMFAGDPFGMGTDAWVPTPLAKYLVDKQPTRIEHAVIWDEKRRALAAWASQARTARETFMRRIDGSEKFKQTTGEGTPTVAAAEGIAARYALAALKQVYAAFLGGMLRSERHNHTDALRPDYSDQCVALSTANMFRAFDNRASVKPFAWRRDTAYFAVADAVPSPPFGEEMLWNGRLQISAQAGKWKDAGRRCEYTDAIRQEVANGSAERVNSAIIAECKRG